MKIAITSQNKKTITKHAGKCRKFWLYTLSGQDTPSRELLELNIDETLQAAEKDKPHHLDDIDVLITGGMGEGLKRRLNAKNIATIVTTELDPDAAIRHYMEQNP